jgi:predicted ATPase/DNA-binding CsgD family transcriptional regulator
MFNLPAYPPLVGRERELTQIQQLLEEPHCRLLTLVGPGGIGKTRLVLEAARRQVDAYRDGIFFVPLQPLVTSDLIVLAIIESLKLPIYGEQGAKTQLLDYLSQRHLLLLLDNFEHLIDGTGIVSDILAHSTNIDILATSRERLNLVQEWVLQVEGLHFPGSDTEAEIATYGAVQLFLQNAQRVQVGFALTEARRLAIARICRLIEGMPLGIELASAWVRALSCDEIAAELEHSLDILATPARDVPQRHGTMRTVLDHSWNLLTAVEQDVFRRLSAFWGGFRREAAHDVAGATLRTLAALVDKSLLRVDATGRYDIHELLRQYAREKLMESGEANDVSTRHRDYYLAFTEQAEPQLFGANQVEWFERVEKEHNNLRAAITWSLESREIAVSLRLTASLYWFWTLHSYHREGYERLMQILSLPEAKGQTTVRAKALNAAGFISWFEGRYVEARLLLDEAISISRALGDLQGLAIGLRTLGPVLYSLGEYEAAGGSLEESLTLSRRVQDSFGTAWSLVFLGDVVLQQGNMQQAKLLYQEGIDLDRELGDKALLAYAVRRLAFVMAQHKDYEQAQTLCQESLRLNLSTGHHRAVAAGLVALAGIALALNHTRYAVNLVAAADRLLQEIAAHLLHTDQREYERHLEIARTRLDTPTFRQAWAEGQSMTMVQAVAYALEERTNLAAPSLVLKPTNQPLIEPLSERELEVMRLLAAGLPYRQVAVELTIAVGSVKSHAHNIYMKLGVKNRMQATARVAELGLL